jgi:hypothetical protein
MKEPSASALSKQYDPERTLRFVAFGMAMGPLIGASTLSNLSNFTPLTAV